MTALPGIRRARGFRLYTGEGRRLVDLWQLGGAALLGHNPPGVLRALKNAASRGLFAPFPHPLQGRLVKALTRLLPGRVFRVYAGEAALRRALAEAGFDGDAPFADPALTPAAAAGPSPALWRPFLGPADKNPPPAGPPVLRLVLPWTLAPPALALEAALDGRFPPSDPVSPVILAGTVRSVLDLLAAPARPRFPRLDRALAGGPWQRRGIYLRPPAGLTGPAYPRLFHRFLERGFLAPPEEGPLILPALLSPG
ncbi:MAG: hypothetical protein LBU28_00450, partial [Spirochaetaceae bacterium]|nr:hypothetical protein [Spirochaetaceae bacterium]